MKTNHTPGPWSFTSNGTLVQNSGNKLHIGTFSESVGLGHAAKANADLIAAAPELLSALETAEAYISALVRLLAPVDAGADAVRVRDAARVAIAKAKGE